MMISFDKNDKYLVDLIFNNFVVVFIYTSKKKQDYYFCREGLQ